MGSSAAANSFHDEAGALGCIAGAYLGFFVSPFGSYPDTAVIRASRGWDMHVLEWIVKHFHNALDPSVAAWHPMSKWPNINVLVLTSKADIQWGHLNLYGRLYE